MCSVVHVASVKKCVMKKKKNILVAQDYKSQDKLTLKKSETYSPENTLQVLKYNFYLFVPFFTSPEGVSISSF